MFWFSQGFSQARIVNKSGTRLVDDIAKDLKSMLEVRINAVKVFAMINTNLKGIIKISIIFQRIVKVAEDLPRVHENTTNFENYTFVNTRQRDEWIKELRRLKAIEDARLEKLSQAEDYKKEKQPDHSSEICYKSNNPDDDDDGEDGDDHECLAKFNETINLKSKEASVFLPVDVFDKGKEIL